MALMTLQRPTLRASRRWLRALEPTPSADIATFVRQLASDIANAADADQWAIAVVGVGSTGEPDFEELIPRPYLEAMNGGHPARYRLTLVLRAEERDLGIVRLGTLRPPGFNDLDIARAQHAAEGASQQLSDALRSTDLEQPQEARASEARGHKQGVVIFDEDRHILALTPVAEELLGWRAEEVFGSSCAAVFDCRGTDGASMCKQCALGVVFDKRAIIEPVLMRMSTGYGGRQPLSASFWYLPPSGHIQQPRAMAVLRAVEEGEDGRSDPPPA